MSLVFVSDANDDRDGNDGGRGGRLLMLLLFLLLPAWNRSWTIHTALISTLQAKELSL